MEDYKKKSVVDGDKEIVFSKAIKAGKRIQCACLHHCRIHGRPWITEWQRDLG